MTRWPTPPSTGPVRVYSYGVRLMPLEPTPDTRPGPLSYLMGLIVKAIGLTAFLLPVLILTKIGA